MKEPFDSVLLIGFGGPTKSDEIRPFLNNVLSGRPVPPERYEEVVHHYELLGGFSLYNELTFRQAEALRQCLYRTDSSLAVYIGMRNWSPYIKDTMEQMVREGGRKTVGFILAPHRTEASWERYQSYVSEAQKHLGPHAPQVSYVEPWYDHPLFLEAAAARVKEALADSGSKNTDQSVLLFTAHSVPLAMANHSSYVEEIKTSAAGVAALLGRSNWSIAYQSRSGNPNVPWLEPDVNEVIRDLARQGVHEVVVVPIGFLCDHVEVLYDLDVEARQTAEEAGVHFIRAGTVGDHPKFIEMMAQVIRQKEEEEAV